MKLSTRSRYGLRAMVDLAQHAEEGPVLLKDIADRQGLSPGYLYHIIASLRADGLITGAKKRRGGYLLTKAPSDIRAHDVITAVEGPLCPVACICDPSVCARSDSCPTVIVWRRLNQSTTEVLKDITLKDLMEQQR